MIVAAAIRFPAKLTEHQPLVKDLICFVPAPGRHHNVLHSMWSQFPDGKTDRTHASYEGEVQGFITDEGVFLNRREAYIHAQENRQIFRKPGGYDGDELFSEDLW